MSRRHVQIFFVVLIILTLAVLAEVAALKPNSS